MRMSGSTEQASVIKPGNESPASRAQSLSAQWCNFAEELETVDVSSTLDAETRSNDYSVEFDETDFALGIAFACTAQAPISGIGW